MEIKVTKLENGLWVISDINKYSSELTYEEMLGLFAALTMPKEPCCLQWMETKEQHEIIEKMRLSSFKNNLMDAEFEEDPVEEIKEGDTFEGNGYTGVFMINPDALLLRKKISQ